MAETRRQTAKGATLLVVLMANWRKYSAFFLKRSWLLLPLVALGVGFALWKSTQEAPAYESRARMMVSGKIALPEGAVYSEELSNFYGTQIELMQSAEIRRRAAARVEAARPDLRVSPVFVSVGQQRGTSFFVLSASGLEPQYTQAFLDACMEEYVQFKRELRSETADTALTAVTDQLLKLDKELQSGEEELVAFQKENSVVFLEEEGNSAGKYLVSLRQKLAGLRTERDLLKLLSLDQAIVREQNQKAPSKEGGNPNATPSPEDESRVLIGAASNYVEAKQNIQLLRAQMERLGKHLRPKHPKIVGLSNMVEQQEKLIELYRQQSNTQLQARRDAIELEIQGLEAAVKEWEEKALSLNQRIANYNRLKSKVERTKALSDRLLSTIQSVDVNKTLGQDVVTIMERASTPMATKPGQTKNLIVGGFTGLALGLGILALMAVLDDRIESTLEIQGNFDEEVLAQIPREPGAESLNILKLDEKNHIFAEACKNLRSSLLFMALDPKPKTYLITSSAPNEGKSTIAMNLAISLAGAGSRTLLVDGDLRRGGLHNYFEFESKPGFAEVLTQEIHWKEVVRTTPQENLFFLPRGRTLANASEYYLGKAADEFLRDIYHEYDYIVMDSAPVLAKEDTASIAPKIDATLFVIRAGVASLRATRSALDTLHKRNVNVLGIVLNFTDRTAPDYYYYKYDKYDEAQPAA